MMRNEKEVEDYAKHRESVRSSIKKTVADSKSKAPEVIDDLDKVQSLRDHELDDDYTKNLEGRSQHWGYHLLLSASECNEGIDDPKVIVNFFKDLVKALKMKPLTEPIVVQVHDKEDGRGTSVMQMITTSHISFHGDDQEWSAYIDIFSCAPYEPLVAINLVKKYFKPKKMGKFWLFRDAGKWPEK